MSARPPVQPGPPRYKLSVLTWIALYPTITVFSWLLLQLGPVDLPLPLRTLVLTAVLVPALVYLLVPALTRLLKPWLQAGYDDQPPATERESSPDASLPDSVDRLAEQS